MSRLLIRSTLLLAATLPHPAASAGLTTLYTFTGGADGAFPDAALIPGPHGSLYGATLAANLNGPPTNSGSGTVFQLSPPAKGATAWTLSTLYTFTGAADGDQPSGIITDSAGAIYGVTESGGTFNGNCTFGSPIDFGCGTVFKLTPPAPGKTGWRFSTLYSFGGAADGYYPTGGLAMDRSGALYGVAAFGGLSTADCTNTGNCGIVFKLTPPASGQTVWTKSALYQFTGGLDGAEPEGTPLLAANGRIYGTTLVGGYRDSAACNAKGSSGVTGCGVVYELAPPASGKTAWTETTLLQLRGNNGNLAQGNLTADQAGNLYGATNAGGDQSDCTTGTEAYNGCGLAFKLAPPAPGSKIRPETILYKFTNGADSSYPWAAPIRAGGAYYMTSSGDEVKTFGSIVTLLPPAGGQTGWTQKTLFSFSNDANGCNPVVGLLFRLGMLYGTTYGDAFLSKPGPAEYGTIFSYVP